MRPSLLLLLVLLLFLSLGSSSTSTTIGCGSAGFSVGAFIGCTGEGEEDPCDYVVTLLVTVVIAADGSPVEGATVTVDTGPPDAFNTRVTGASGQATWTDTAFLTGFSARCDGEDVGTVEPYDPGTSFSWDLLVTAPGLAPAGAIITINRGTRDLALTVRMEP